MGPKHGADGTNPHLHLRFVSPRIRSGIGAVRFGFWDRPSPIFHRPPPPAWNVSVIGAIQRTRHRMCQLEFRGPLCCRRCDYHAHGMATWPAGPSSHYTRHLKMPMLFMQFTAIANSPRQGGCTLACAYANASVGMPLSSTEHFCKCCKDSNPKCTGRVRGSIHRSIENVWTESLI